MKSSLYILLIFVPVFLTINCTRKPEQDPRIEKLQTEVEKLAQQNKEMESEIRKLEKQLQEQRAEAAIPAQQTKPSEQTNKMTVDRMKQEIKPVLDGAIKELKLHAETPRKGSQFGMRVEYDMKKAFYGLIETGNTQVPYQAKVIVTFEKFLESEKESKSYGKGSTMLLFSYRGKRWILDSAS